VQVEDAYYDLVNAWQNVAIQEEGLAHRERAGQSNARLAARGAVAPTDIVEANTQVNVFQDNVYAAIQNVQRVQQQLKQLLLSNPADPVWFANLVPTTPAAQIPQEPSLDALINSAIQNRPEVAQVRAQRRQSDLNLAYAKGSAQAAARPRAGLYLERFCGQPAQPAGESVVRVSRHDRTAGLAVGVSSPPGIRPVPSVSHFRPCSTTAFRPIMLS